MNIPEWNWRYLFSPTIFLGLYHWVDYIFFILHRGWRRVFWCGNDIIQLEKSKFWKQIIPKITASHFCENNVEYEKLKKMGIDSIILPMIFSNPLQFPLSYSPNFYVSLVYCCIRKGREEEYGMDIIHRISLKLPDIQFHIYGIDGINTKNIVYHGDVFDEKFNEEIRNYHAAVRFNKFDGFSDVLAKSILMGQYPISCIAYPYVTNYHNENELICFLRKLKDKRNPNDTARDYWIKELEMNKIKLLSYKESYG